MRAIDKPKLFGTTNTEPDDDCDDAEDPGERQVALTADAVSDEADAAVGGDSSNVVPGLESNSLRRGVANALEPGGQPCVHAVHAELANEVSGPDSSGRDDELLGEQDVRGGLGRLRRNDEELRVEVSLFLASGAAADG